MIQYLTAEDIAKILKVSKSQVLQRIVSQPSFPRARRFPTTEGRSHPRWKESEVEEWLDRQ